MSRNGQIDIGDALQRARGMSPFSADGVVAHRLSDEVERMRAFMANVYFNFPVTVLTAYQQNEQRILDHEQGRTSVAVPGSDT